MGKLSSKEKILNASVKLFKKYGYKKVTTKAIAKEAGLNEVTLFRQFGSKKGIVQEILEDRLPFLQSIQLYLENEAVFILEKDLIKVANLFYEAIYDNIDLLMVLTYEMGPEFQQAASLLPKELKDALTNYFTKMIKKEKVINMDTEMLSVSFISSNIGFVMINKLFNNNFTNISSQLFIKKNIGSFVNGIAT